MHVLSTPPAFILSQDQTLRCSHSSSKPALLNSNFRLLLELPIATSAAYPIKDIASRRLPLLGLLPLEGFESAFIHLALALSGHSKIDQRLSKSLRSGRSCFNLELFIGSRARDSAPSNIPSSNPALFFLTGPHTSAALPSSHLPKQLLLNPTPQLALYSPAFAEHGYGLNRRSRTFDDAAKASVPKLFFCPGAPLPPSRASSALRSLNRF